MLKLWRQVLCATTRVFPLNLKFYPKGTSTLEKSIRILTETKEYSVDGHVIHAEKHCSDDVWTNDNDLQERGIPVEVNQIVNYSWHNDLLV